MDGSEWGSCETTRAGSQFRGGKSALAQASSPWTDKRRHTRDNRQVSQVTPCIVLFEVSRLAIYSRAFPAALQEWQASFHSQRISAPIDCRHADQGHAPNEPCVACLSMPLYLHARAGRVLIRRTTPLTLRSIHIIALVSGGLSDYFVSVNKVCIFWSFIQDCGSLCCLCHRQGKWTPSVSGHYCHLKNRQHCCQLLSWPKAGHSFQQRQDRDRCAECQSLRTGRAAH